MKKNGFTLIELLAVIIVISIIAVITVPIVLDTIDNSKKGTAMDSAYGYVEAVNRLYYSNSMDGEDDIDDGIYSVSELKTNGVSISGREPSDGWVELVDGDVVSYSIKFGDYVITKYSDSAAVAVKDGDIEYYEYVRNSMDAADAYVKSALTKYASLELEDAKTVAQMTTDSLTKPENLATTGWIHFNVESSTVSVVDYSLKFGDYVADYSSLTDGNYVSSITTGNERNKPVIIAVGSEICYGPSNAQECFKVIKTDSNKTLLFANYNLKHSTNPATVTYKQESSSPATIQFSESNYWHDTTNDELKIAYAKDINNISASYSGNPKPYIYDSNSNTHAYVEGYLTTLKTAIYGLPATATGRLLTYEEARNTSMFVNYSARQNGSDYWLGSANNSSHVWAVTSSGGFSSNLYYACRGVRPVIEISTSDIQ